jgi:hypothetical protein
VCDIGKQNVLRAARVHAVVAVAVIVVALGSPLYLRKLGSQRRINANRFKMKIRDRLRYMAAFLMFLCSASNIDD